MSVSSSVPSRDVVLAEPAGPPAPLRNYPPLFTSFFMAGFEASSHRRKDGRRLDLIASTGHDVFARQDYERCAQFGLRTVRDGLRWHLIETRRGEYDWSSWTSMLRAAKAAGVRVIWDLFHYGHPDFLDISTPEFVDAMAEFAAAAVRVHHQEMGEAAAPLFCPANELSFLAWAVDVGYFPPENVEKGIAFKRQLVRIAIAGAKAAREADPRCRLIWAEPLIHVAPRHHGRSELRRAEAYRVAQFEAYDMLTGRSDPELGGGPDLVDVVGLNYYPHNQWYYHGPTIPMGHHEYRALAEMLVETYRRYGKPLFIAETGAEGSGRPAWLHYVCDEVRAATERGAEIEGVCLYPITEYLGWDNERYCDVGLFTMADDSGRRETFAPMVAEIDRQRSTPLTPQQRELDAICAEADDLERRFGLRALEVAQTRLEFDQRAGSPLTPRRRHVVSELLLRQREDQDRPPAADGGCVHPRADRFRRSAPALGWEGRRASPYAAGSS